MEAQQTTVVAPTPKSTPAKGAPPPAAASPETLAAPAGETLNELLERGVTIEGEDEGAPAAEGTEDEAIETAEAPEVEPSAANAAKPEDASAEELFTAEALATPEGIGRAREVLQTAQKELSKRHAKLDRFELRLEARAKKDAVERQALAGEVDRTRKIGAAISAEIGVLLDPARPARERLASFGRIAGADGLQLFEELSLGVAQDGKAPPPTAGERALKQQLEELNAKLDRERGSRDEAAATGRVDALRGGIEAKMAEIQAECSNAEVAPNLAAGIADGKWDASEAAELVAAEMASHFKKTKKSLARADAIKTIEARLAKALGPSGRAGQSPESSSGTLPKVPSSPARRAGSRGVTVTPTLADRSSGRGRQLSDTERLDEAARDPELMDSIFGKLAR